MACDTESLGEKIVSDKWFDYVRTIISAGRSDPDIASVSQVFAQRVLQNTKYVSSTDK